MWGKSFNHISSIQWTNMFKVSYCIRRNSLKIFHRIRRTLAKVVVVCSYIVIFCQKHYLDKWISWRIAKPSPYLYEEIIPTTLNIPIFSLPPHILYCRKMWKKTKWKKIFVCVMALVKHFIRKLNNDGYLTMIQFPKYIF